MKLRQGNVFTPVCDSVHRGDLCLEGLCPGGLCQGQGVSFWGVSVQGCLCQEDPRTVTCRWYASYWNAFLFETLYSVADPGFSPGGCANSQKCYYFSIFLPKTAWKWKNLDPGGARPWRPQPLDPPMILFWKKPNITKKIYLINDSRFVEARIVFPFVTVN